MGKPVTAMETGVVRSEEEYLGAFTESLKLTLPQNPVERLANAVFLAAKTALHLKATNPGLKEHEIATILQAITHRVRMHSIIHDLTPEEKRMMKLNRLLPPEYSFQPKASPKSTARKRRPLAKKKSSPRPRA
jgi:hypothetical protein